MGFSIKNSKELTFNDKTIYVSQFGIDKIIEKDGCVAVLLTCPKLPVIFEDQNCNVFVCDKFGNVLWVVSDVNQNRYPQNHCLFTEIVLNEKGNLVLMNWCDFNLIVDFQTGTVLEKYFDR